MLDQTAEKDMARKRRLPRKPSDEVQLKLRFDESLRSHLARQAKQNHRSLNTEINFRLYESIRFDRIKKEANSLLDQSSFDVSMFDDMARNMIKDLHDVLKKQMSEVQATIMQKLRAKPEDEGEGQ
jgi:hypothetical protein